VSFVAFQNIVLDMLALFLKFQKMTCLPFLDSGFLPPNCVKFISEGAGILRLIYNITSDSITGSFGMCMLTPIFFNFSETGA